jgi:hypothetical protein
MAAFLSDEWFAFVREAAGALPAVDGASLSMQHLVSGAPGGKVQCIVDVHDGRVVDARIGKAADAACTLGWTYADARAALQGDLNLDVAFMRGDLKIDGNYVGFMLGLRRMFNSDEAAQFVAAVRAATD